MKEPIPFDFPAFHFKPEWGVSIIPTPDHTVKILVTDKKSKQYATIVGIKPTWEGGEWQLNGKPTKSEQITKEIEKIFNQEANQ